MEPSIIDTHAHLNDMADLANVLARAKAAGIRAIVAVGVNHDSDKKTLEIVSRFNNPEIYPPIYPAIGLHPGDINTSEPEGLFDFIEENIDKIVAIGESGLDYWYKEARKDGPARELQGRVFAKQVDIAKRHDKPIVIHSRGAWKECLKKTKEAGIKRAVFHWYSGPEDVLREILAEGYFMSAAPSCEYSPEHRKAIETAPLERMLLETDSPVVYKPASGRYKSEPKDVARVLKEVAKIKNVPEEEVAVMTTRNAGAFFNLS
ncbi:MAG: TatD family hydrolase [Candidatus Omnitrophica bacterium]|nr:TatD family hydrolase [Candidatus Omnitrophota bacterium]